MLQDTVQARGWQDMIVHLRFPRVTLVEALRVTIRDTIIFLVIPFLTLRDNQGVTRRFWC